MACGAQAAPVDFEGFGDTFTLTHEVAGVQVSGGTVLTAGVGLNEWDFPPTSGSNVLSALTGALVLSFDSAVSSFSAYFTHSSSLHFLGLDALGTVLFDSVTATVDNLGATELLSYTASGLKTLQITDYTGNAFVLDDMSFPGAGAAAVPEAPTLALVSLGLVLAARQRRRNPRG